MGKPQPVDTIDVDDRYVEAYERSHANATVDYKLGYREYFTVDSLLPSPYIALIAGCGTLGAPLNLLRGAGRIVGVDRSAKMLASASRLSQRAVGKDIELIQCDVVSFPSRCREQFDFVELGLMGTYLPFDVELIEAYASLVKPDGLLLVASVIVPPAGLRQKGALAHARAILASVVSTGLFWLTGKTNHRTSVSLRVAARSLERSISGQNGRGVEMLYHEVRKNAAESPVTYRALLRKLA